ncbi:esterase-like activity of phytase family protein [Tautonia plasticadhaerens]|uniref:Phytase-like domain-containing protein n=1 Tax=Tautonia plasticadhaerens TaxID=2527974 RepID=A0A518HCT1_9BACT|nr:esterase-like activity of phytase family protein [Tautonia plasticadhaerens]QDV38674.1 hypothetical protein ElP_66290 [Tautonia plasticadhaerens]
MRLIEVLLLSIPPATAPGSSRDGQAVEAIEYLGQATLPGTLTEDGTRVGGLSGLAFDEGEGVFLALSDDRGGPDSPAPRAYRLRIDLADGRLDPGDVGVEGVLVLTRRDGSAVPAGTADAEGIALGGGGGLFIGSEGIPGADPPVPPSVDRFDRGAGRHVGAFEVPAAYRPGPGRGVRENLGFESLTITPGGRFVDAATENALLQDGPAASVESGTTCRILRFDRASGEPAAEFAYEAGPIVGRIGPRVAGLVELLAIDESRWLALERSFSAGSGCSIRLFEASIDGATDLQGVDALADRPGVVPVSKRLVLDLGTLGEFLPTNLEGMAFGPDLPDGRRSLILVADNNRMALLPSQFVAFGVTMAPSE